MEFIESVGLYLDMHGSVTQSQWLVLGPAAPDLQCLTSLVAVATNRLSPQSGMALSENRFQWMIKLFTTKMIR